MQSHLVEPYLSSYANRLGRKMAKAYRTTLQSRTTQARAARQPKQQDKRAGERQG